MRISILESRRIAQKPKRDIAAKDHRANLSHVAYEVRDGRQRPAPDVHVRVHRQILIPHFDLGELYVHAAGIICRTLECSAYYDKVVQGHTKLFA